MSRAGKQFRDLRQPDEPLFISAVCQSKHASIKWYFLSYLYKLFCGVSVITARKFAQFLWEFSSARCDHVYVMIGRKEILFAEQHFELFFLRLGMRIISNCPQTFFYTIDMVLSVLNCI